MAKTLGELIKGFNRPPSRPVQKDAYEEEADRRKMMSGMDVEFRADLDPILRDDPLSRLGYGGGVKFIDEEDFDGAWHIPNSYPVPLQAELTQGNLGAPVGRTDVAYTADYGGSPEVIAHEMRHRGLDRVYDMYLKDPDAFANEYGIETAMYIEQVGQDRATNEAFTEVGDVPHEHKEWLDADGVDQKKRKLSETFSTPRDYLDNEQVRNAYKQIQRAAQDSLRAAGEPPRTIPKEVEEEGQGWFRSLIEKIGFAEGGLTPNQQRRAGYGGRAMAPEDEQMMSLGFSAPMSAGPGDVDWGVRDELGRPVRETVLGQQYSVREQTPQETTTLKEDVGRFVGTLGEWKSKGFPLPSSSQVADAAKNVAVSIADSAERVARSEGTVGEVMGFAATPISAASTARVPAGALTSGAAKREAATKENPLFRSRREIPRQEVDLKEEGYGDLIQAPYSFYSPIRQTVENMDFGKTGTVSGAAIESELNRVMNQGQGIRNSEFKAADIKFDPKKRYTKEEAMQLAYENTWEIKPLYDQAYEYEQRISTNDKIENYVEITLEATKPKGGTFEPSGKRDGDPGTHYTSSTVAHVRLSERIGDEGNYLLVEEFQSDLFQKGAKEKVTGQKPLTMEEVRPRMSEDLDNLVTKMEKPFKNFTEEKKQLILDYAIAGMKWEGSKGYDDFINAEEAVFKALGERGTDLAIDLMNDYRGVLKGVKPVKDAPFAKPEDWLRLTILSTIAEAQKRGITEVAIPSAKDLADLRYTVDMDSGVKRPLLESQKSGFYKLYGKTLDKVIRQVEEELGEIGQTNKTLSAQKMTAFDKRALEELDTDIQEFEDLMDAPIDAIMEQNFVELVKDIKDRGGMKTADAMTVAKQIQEDYWTWTDLGNRFKDTEVKVLDLSNLPNLSETEMRFAQGGLVDYLSPESFKDYLEEENYG